VHERSRPPNATSISCHAEIDVARSLDAFAQLLVSASRAVIALLECFSHAWS
jgi:hypothetical protein